VFVGESYIRIVGLTPLLDRVFTAGDSSPGSNVAIVNDRFASQHFGGATAIGQRVALARAGADAPATGWVTIVGIVPNVRYEEEDARQVEPVIYLPKTSNPQLATNILARAEGGVAAAHTEVAAAVRRIDPDLAVFDARALDDVIDTEMVLFRVFGTVFGLFAGLALVLASVGLYGVTAYALVQRTREIGVRVALGARRAHVWWLVSRGAARQLAIGLAIGLAGAFAMGRLMQGILSSVDASDPIGLVAIALVLVVVSLAACLPPVRRAVRLNPVDALRAE
jgi:putative ABC transport system permease protein